MPRAVSRTGSSSSSASLTQYTLTDLFASPKTTKPLKRPAAADEVETPKKRARILRQRNGDGCVDKMDVDGETDVENKAGIEHDSDDDSDEEQARPATVRRPTHLHTVRAHASMRPGHFAKRMLRMYGYYFYYYLYSYYSFSIFSTIAPLAGFVRHNRPIPLSVNHA